MHPEQTRPSAGQGKHHEQNGKFNIMQESGKTNKARLFTLTIPAADIHHVARTRSGVCHFAAATGKHAYILIYHNASYRQYSENKTVSKQITAAEVCIYNEQDISRLSPAKSKLCNKIQASEA